jgi:hypothetical protein
MAKPKKAPPQKHEEFVFRIRAPSVGYSFRIEHDRQRREWQPFAERHTLHFITECIWPDRLKGREGKATIYPEPGYVDLKLLDEGDAQRKWIGYVRATKGEFETVVWLPPQVCWHIGEAMASGLIRSMLANGPVEPRGMHRVIATSFYGPEFDPVDYVG